MSAPACLVVSTPELDEPERTPPFLIASTADPDSRKVVLIDSDAQRKFSALVRSEDDGGDLSVAMYIDYGDPSGNYEPGQDIPKWPYYKWFPGPPVEAGTFSELDRRASATYFPILDPIKPGCHTLTMIVSHEFVENEDGRYCPRDLTDSSQLTWIVFRCDAEQCPADLKQLAAEQCPSAGLTCPARGDEPSTDLDAADGGTPAEGAGP